MSRVTRIADGDPIVAEGVERHALVPPERGSELALDALRLEPGASLDLTDPLHDTLVFAHAGSGALDDATLTGGRRASSPRGAPAR